jgi:hypothetical protein
MYNHIYDLYLKYNVCQILHIPIFASAAGTPFGLTHIGVHVQDGLTQEAIGQVLCIKITSARRQ